MKNREKKIVKIKEKLSIQNLVIALLLFPIMVILSTLLGVFFISINFFNITVAVLTTLITEIIVIILALYYTENTANWKNFLRLKNFNLISFLKGMIIGLVFWIMLQVFAISFEMLGIGLQSSDTSVSLVSTEGVSRWVTLYFVVPFIVPFFEEVFFRSTIMGFAERGIKNDKNSKVVAILLSSVIFGLAHAQGFSTFTDFFIIVWTGLMGLINARLVYKYDSVYPAYGVHLSYNGITALLSALFI